MAIWLLIFGVRTVLVRAGLTLLTAGVVRPADAADALLAAAADAAAAVLAFWAVRGRPPVRPRRRPRWRSTRT